MREAGKKREIEGVKEGLVAFLGEADLMAGQGSGSRLRRDWEGKWPSRGGMERETRKSGREKGNGWGGGGREIGNERERE